MTSSQWRAGFELEVVLGDLDEARFARHLDEAGAMDEADPAFCRAVAKRLRELTGRAWTAPLGTSARPGYYVVPEYGLDPLHWPRDRLAGVELLTPPLPLEEADAVRSEIAEAVEWMDGPFNFISSETTSECGWHINIDAKDQCRLDPAAYAVGCDELPILSRNSRLFTPYTGLQRHAVGIGLLRHLQFDGNGDLLRTTGLANLLQVTAGRSKRYAANFSKVERGYLELRHFSALSFFNGPGLLEQLDGILTALEATATEQHHADRIFLQRFVLLFEWLEEVRSRITLELRPSKMLSHGRVLFDEEPIATLTMDGPIKLELHGPKQYQCIAAIEGLMLPDIPEAVALLALDLSDLRRLGVRRPPSPGAGFRRAISKLARRLRSDAVPSSSRQA